jgi:sulfate/thiosulfate transport system permease protein
LAIQTDVKAPAGTPAGAGGVPKRSRRGAVPTGLRLHGASGLSLGVGVLWLSLIVLIPLVAVVGKAFGDGWGHFWSAITADEAASAIKLTLGLALLVAIVNGIMGTLVAWVLVRDRFRGSAVIEFVIDIPFALPTVVAGVVMLALYGGQHAWAPNLLGSRYGLFVTLVFVTLPFTVRTVQPVLIDLDRDVEQAAASLGASPVAVFRRIVLPQILPAAVSGASLSFARALGEYGSLVFLSNGLAGKVVVSSIIYADLDNSDSPERATQQASAIAALLLVASAIVLILVDQLQRRVARRG